jgi:hypothetical protein
MPVPLSLLNPITLTSAYDVWIFSNYNKFVLQKDQEYSINSSVAVADCCCSFTANL